MSSRTDDKNILTYTLDVKVGAMHRSRLPELIQKARDSGLSFRDIQRRAGGDIPLSTLNALHKGKGRFANPNLTTETICALARGLGESPTVVFEAAIGRASTGLKDESLVQLLEDFGRLSARDRENPRLKVALDMFKSELQNLLDRNA